MTRELEKIARVYGGMNLKKQRKKRQKLIIKDLCVEYARNSTLHGLRYVTASGLTLIEKLFWMSTCLMSVALCGYFIGNVYQKWTTSPVIVSISEKLVSVNDVPFPSVTICPQIKTLSDQYNFSHNINQSISKNFTFDEYEEDLNKLLDISQVCKYNTSLFTSNRNFTDSKMLQNIGMVAPLYPETFDSCYWQNNKVNCNIFKIVFTAEGLCFNMNGISPNEMFQNTEKEILSLNSNSIRGWSMETGYSDLEKDPFPKRGNENHASPDLEIFLRSREIDRDPLCNGLKSGFEIYLHHPADYPQSSLYHYSAVNGEVTTLAVSLHAQSTSDSLARYSPDVRQCYFQSDRYLRYFKNYTTKNCKAECLSNYTQEHCGCVGFYMPHDNSSLFCAENKMDCMRKAYNKMVQKQLPVELGLDMPVSGCHCLPACESIEYDAEVLKTAFITENFEVQRRCHYHGISSSCYYYSLDFEEEYNISKVEIYFKKSQFMSFHRSELFGITDLLANIGGILDLFLGFSFLSLVEILYFITLRLGVAIRRDIVEEKKK
ncbi:Gonad-specific amiloride-sensitive sodium channel 1, partial [Operophtera brumata]